MLGSFGTMLAAWIKVGSLSPDRFYVTFIGQTVAAVAQIFVLGIPAKLAAVWFGQDQVSSACAIGVFGNQVCGEWGGGTVGEREDVIQRMPYHCLVSLRGSG